MKVVLFKINWWNPKAAIIGLATVSAYCHAAIMLDDGTLFDASESRGDINYGFPLHSHGSKQILVYSIPYEHKEAIEHALSKRGAKYGWKGIFGWGFQVLTLGLFKISNGKNLYCFEFVLYVLNCIKEIKQESPDIFDKLFTAKIDSDDLTAVLERSYCPVFYEGKAEDFLAKA